MCLIVDFTRGGCWWQIVIVGEWFHQKASSIVAVAAIHIKLECRELRFNMRGGTTTIHLLRVYFVASCSFLFLRRKTTSPLITLPFSSLIPKPQSNEKPVNQNQ
ncbi:hypothetical protein L1887_04987 [Cichorium endivia]|nr:hypothetical protein L1887_04987 [Cichorium endivia]